MATIYVTFYTVENRKSENTKVIAVDPAKYKEDGYAGASKFLNRHTDEFLKAVD